MNRFNGFFDSLENHVDSVYVMKVVDGEVWLEVDVRSQMPEGRKQMAIMETFRFAQDERRVS